MGGMISAERIWSGYVERFNESKFSKFSFIFGVL